MSQCDFNHKKFKQYISVKTKITPALSDDWVIVNRAYNNKGGMGLYSEKLDQYVQDIDLRRFLDLCVEKDITIQGNKVMGSYIIGNDRVVYDGEDYAKWLSTFTKRTSTLIPKKNWVVGHQYKTPCGKEVVYLGSRYVASIKQDANFRDMSISLDINCITKITKKYFYCSITEKNEIYIYGVSPSVYSNAIKFNTDVGKVISEELADTYLNMYYWENSKIVYFNKDNKHKPTQLSLATTSVDNIPPHRISQYLVGHIKDDYISLAYIDRMINYKVCKTIKCKSTRDYYLQENSSDLSLAIISYVYHTRTREWTNEVDSYIEGASLSSFRYRNSHRIEIPITSVTRIVFI